MKFFTFLAKALRIVVLAQPSSASVERVFSQLKMIVDACGERMLEETLETRMFYRCADDECADDED